MSRNSSTFKESYNRALDMVQGIGVQNALPTEVALSQAWDVSRTTVRGILNSMQESGIIDWSGRSKVILRKPRASEYFAQEETASVADRMPSLFMEYIFERELTPGTRLHETELAKQFDVSSTVVREFLIRFSRFGLIQKEPNRHWVLVGFTPAFADELFAVREIFEQRAFEAYLQGGAFEAAVQIRADHLAILDNIDRDYLRFPRLDEEFHRLWIDAFENRFMSDFFELVSLVFHYHYRWNKSDEKERNSDAIVQHLEIIDGLMAADLKAAKRAFRNHLVHARETLMASAIWGDS
ncbi:MAG: GntR family transcriptional regulator [Pseudomonadota bacterium]